MREIRAALAVVCCVALAACGLLGGEPSSSPPAVTVWPAFDSTHARTDQGLVIRARGGALTEVRVYANGERVPGGLDPSGGAWRSTWTLAPGTEYSVAVRAAGGGLTASATGRFRTRQAANPLQVASVAPDHGETVGVGMPIVVTFNRPVKNRTAVERALEVRTAQPVEGAWRWVDETQVVYRTRRFWSARQPVSLVAHLAGVRAAPGVLGGADRQVDFTVGRRQVSTINTLTKQMLVRRDGRLAQRMAISAGRGGTREYTTTSGVHLTMDKGNPVRMVSPGRRKGDPGYYDLLIDHAVRISNSGEYVHAKDNLWAQGLVNVSHGCVNARPDQAAWFYAGSLRGDPVTIVGTDRELEWDNGWGFWQLAWARWVRGSALRVPMAPPSTTS